MADPQVYNNDLKRLQAKYEDFGRQLRELHTLTDSQFERTVQKMLELVDNLDTRVDAAIQQRSLTVDQIAARDAATLSSANAYAEPKIGILPANKGGTNTANGYANLFSTGPYRAAWLLSDGTLGTSQSSRTVKTDFHEPDISLEQLRAVDWIGYRYINDINQNSDSALPRVGMIAEELDDAGLGIFVVYDDETLAPVSIDYATLSVAAMHLAKVAHDRIDALEARIQTLENKEES